MKRLVLLSLASLSLLACEPKLAPAPPPASYDANGNKVDPPIPRDEVPTADAKPTEAKPAEAAHDHKAPHGGSLADTKTGHVELKAAPDGQLMVWLYDDKLTPLAADGAEVSVKVALPDYADVKLEAHGDHMMGKGAPLAGDHMAAIVTVKRGEQVETAKVELHLAPHDAPPSPDPKPADDHAHDHAHGHDHKH